MKIAITGARGTVGREVVKFCAKEGHETVQINRSEQECNVARTFHTHAHQSNAQPDDGTKNSEMRIADAANNYDDTVKAFKGCDAVIHLAALPNPVGKEDWQVHSNNVNSAFNGLRAAAELGITRFCYASSVNAIGLAYANQPLHFDYFPIDEAAPANPTDSYALAKQEAEMQAKAFANWFPGMNIACLRIHEVAPRKEVLEEHRGNWDETAVKQLFGWVNPEATARACLLACTTDNIKGCEIFNIIAPDTTQDTPSKELAEKYFPKAEIRGGWGEKNQAFWTTDKANKMLGWVHHEKE